MVWCATVLLKRALGRIKKPGEATFDRRSFNGTGFNYIYAKTLGEGSMSPFVPYFRRPYNILHWSSKTGLEAPTSLT